MNDDVSTGRGKSTRDFTTEAARGTRDEYDLPLSESLAGMRCGFRLSRLCLACRRAQSHCYRKDGPQRIPADQGYTT